MTTSTPEKADGLKALENAIEKIKESIEDLGGVFNIQMAPKVVTATDEADLARRMDRAEAENAEIDGDDEEGEEEGMKFDGDVDGGAPEADADNDDGLGASDTEDSKNVSK